MPTSPFRFYESLRVFLACPGDLVAERSRFPRILDKVNSLRAHSMGFYLEAVGWERVVPSFGRPQALINEELMTADLTLILFWNKMGSPSGAENGVTGTQEEFEIAVKRCGDDAALDPSGNRPSLCVYFRDQTVADTEAAAGVRTFRQKIEDEKRLLYRQYATETEWEELVTEHLVAFLNGRRRTSLEAAVDTLAKLGPPKNPVLIGKFYWQESYDHSYIPTAEFDFDGDDNEERVKFWFQQSGYWMNFTSGDHTRYVQMSPELDEALSNSKRIHLAVKDVNNDGLPEFLVAASDDCIDAILGIFGCQDGDSFEQLALLRGQNIIYVLEHGHIAIPYGSVGFYTYYSWLNGKYEEEDRQDASRKFSVFGRLG